VNRGKDVAIDSSKTVDRGIRLLFELAENPRGLTVTELASRLGTQRPPLYRLLQTLSDYRLIRRDDNKLYTLSIGVLELARAFSAPFIDRARGPLQEAADATGASAMLNLADGDSLVVALCVPPRSSDIHLAIQAGTRYPHHQVAPWVAILAARPEQDDDPDLVREARARGYATSAGQVRPGLGGVAVALTLPQTEGSISLVSSSPDEDEERMVPAAIAAARAISALA